MKLLKCKHCGYENAIGTSRCAKCNADLTGSMGRHQENSKDNVNKKNQHHDTDRDEDAQMVGRETLRDEEFSALRKGKDNHVAARCPHCNFELRVDEDYEFCPNCGKSIKGGMRTLPKEQGRDSWVCSQCGNNLPQDYAFCPKCGQPKSGKASNTVNPYAFIPKIALRPIDGGPAIGMTGTKDDNNTSGASAFKFLLNRGNVSPGDLSLSSKDHAHIVMRQGPDVKKWHIEDHSSNGCTFVAAKRPIELQDGDIIVLGNSRYEFRIK